MNRFRLRLLALIQCHDGQLSWYQIDRAISADNTQREEHLMDALRDLTSEGFISSQVGANPSQPTNKIAWEGEKAVRVTGEERTAKSVSRMTLAPFGRIVKSRQR